MFRIGLSSVLGCTLLGACSPGDPGANQTAAEVPPAIGETTGVTRSVVEPAPAQASAPQPPAIQIQPGPKGAQVALNRVSVVGDVMTVALSYSGGDCCAYADMDKISVIDDSTSQRLSALKDNAGNWMAAPLDSGGNTLRVTASKDSPAQVWFKFPAPPATSETVSITIPEVAPFDGIRIAR